MRTSRSVTFCRTALISLCLAAPNLIIGPALSQPIGLPSMGATSGSDLSPGMERSLGELIIAQGRLDPSFVQDAEINQYLNQMAQRLVRYAPGGAAHVELFAMRDPQFNAFAMPGGFIGINTGVITVSSNESELAGVVAHEIAHVTQRHVARGITQQKQNSTVMLASIAAALLAGLAGGVNLAAGVAAFGQAAAIDRQLGFSRDAEREADRIGLQMLSKAGYDPRGMQGMFGKLMQASNLNYGTAGGNTYLSTHPLSIDRMGDMENRTRTLPSATRPDADAYWYVRAKAQVVQSVDRPTLLRLRDRLQNDVTRTSGVQRSAVYLALSELALKQGDQAKALEYIQQARQGVPDSPYLRRQLAWVELLRGQPQIALNLTRSGLQQWPDHVALSEVQAHALQRMGQFNEAADVLGKVLAKWPNEFPRLYQLRANNLISANKPIEARMAMAQFYELTGAYAAAIAQLDQARHMAKDFRQQSTLDVRIREVKHKMAQERELLEKFGA